MKIRDFLKKVYFYPRALFLRMQIAIAKSLLHGKYQWYALDQMGIKGHGTDLLRIDFPPLQATQPAWGYEKSPHPELAALIDKNFSEQFGLLQSFLPLTTDYLLWPEHEDSSQPDIPWRNNQFLLPFDMISLYGLLQFLQPKQYLEIGSGMSTRIAHLARSRTAFPMKITSIDPEPRLAIANLCDKVYQCRLEDLGFQEFLNIVTSETIIFFDGSHRSFPNSDVTVFFIDILPRLPSGCIIHIHDIYLPNDYPSKALCMFWSEQYLLATYLLGGTKDIEIFLPCASLSSKSEVKDLFVESFHTNTFNGCSFWIRKK